MVNIIFLLATKDRPPDVGPGRLGPSKQRRLFLRSNDLVHDYSATSSAKSLSEALVLPQTNESDSRRYHYRLDLAQIGSRQATSGEQDLLATSWPSTPPNGSTSNWRMPAPGNKVIYQDYRGPERDQPSARYLRVRVKSSRNHVLVRADDIVIHESKTNPAAGADSTDGRGLHVLVLNQFHGALMASRLFDTYLPNQDQELAHFLGLVGEGRILVLAVKDEASFKLGPGARNLLRELGSEHIGQLRWRDMWALVAVKRLALHTSRELGQSQLDHLRAQTRNWTLAEAVAKSPGFADWAPPVELDVKLELDDERRDPAGACDWMSAESADDQRRRAFCNRIEGYERVCDCNFPAPISFNPVKVS